MLGGFPSIGQTGRKAGGYFVFKSVISHCKNKMRVLYKKSDPKKLSTSLKAPAECPQFVSIPNACQGQSSSGLIAGIIAVIK
jgi:hypothetical protein